MKVGHCGRGALILMVVPLLLSGCGSEAANLALGVGSVVVAPVALTGAKVPTDEIAQIYYLGVHDPQGQLPPTIYRVRVQGQSSFLNNTKFASGWVQASLIDSLGTRIAFNEQNGGLKIEKVNSDNQGQITTGRRLLMFGPEGFREAPKDHRLVVVMGSDPSAFFQAVDQTLGVIAQATQGVASSKLRDALFEELIRVKSERQELNDLAYQVSSRGDEK